MVHLQIAPHAINQSVVISQLRRRITKNHIANEIFRGGGRRRAVLYCVNTIETGAVWAPPGKNPLAKPRATCRLPLRVNNPPD